MVFFYFMVKISEKKFLNNDPTLTSINCNYNEIANIEVEK